MTHSRRVCVCVCPLIGWDGIAPMRAGDPDTHAYVPTDTHAHHMHVCVHPNGFACCRGDVRESREQRGRAEAFFA